MNWSTHSRQISRVRYGESKVRGTLAFLVLEHIDVDSSGVDPHLDTPVEILHVILLGFVKYFWRDAITRQNAERRALLITRLSSLDVTGLGCSTLSGQTLVQYAGSLTGRDFRAVAQAAPFVLYDLVDEDCYRSWVALSSLIPIVWQPEIEDIENHLVSAGPALIVQSYLMAMCRQRWSGPSTTFSIVPFSGLLGGLTNLSSTLFAICHFMCAGSGPPFSLLQRHLNHTMR